MVNVNVMLTFGVWLANKSLPIWKGLLATFQRFEPLLCPTTNFIAPHCQGNPSFLIMSHAGTICECMRRCWGATLTCRRLRTRVFVCIVRDSSPLFTATCSSGWCSKVETGYSIVNGTWQLCIQCNILLARWGEDDSALYSCVLTTRGTVVM